MHARFDSLARIASRSCSYGLHCQQSPLHGPAASMSFVNKSAHHLRHNVTWAPHLQKWERCQSTPALLMT